MVSGSIKNDAFFSYQQPKDKERHYRKGGKSGNNPPRGGGNNNNPQQSHNFKCHNCSEKGHFARNCPRKKRQENANITEKHEYFCPQFALQTDDRSSNMNDWWIDSGASQHMVKKLLAVDGS